MSVYLKSEPHPAYVGTCWSLVCHVLRPPARPQKGRIGPAPGGMRRKAPGMEVLHRFKKCYLDNGLRGRSGKNRAPSFQMVSGGVELAPLGGPTAPVAWWMRAS